MIPSFRKYFIEQKYEMALTSAATISDDDPFALEAIHVAGLSLIHLNRNDGIGYLERSLTGPQAKASWFINAANVMIAKDLAYANRFVAQGLLAYPDNASLLCMRGICLLSERQWAKAIEYFDQALILAPASFHAIANKAHALALLNDLDAAIGCYQHVVEPTAEVINNWASVLYEQAKPYEAMALIDRHFPNTTLPELLYLKALIYLGLGSWPLGWQLYRQRHQIDTHGEMGVLPECGIPLPNGLEELRDKSVLLYGEQGLGDCLMFIRYARLLRPIVAKLTICVPSSLTRLMQHLDVNEFDVVTDASSGKYDLIVPTQDVPALMKTTLATIPSEIPYFILDGLASRCIDDARIRVGLVWAGGSSGGFRQEVMDQRRSMTFDVIEPLLARFDQIRFVSLQMPDHRVPDARLVQPLQAHFDMLDTAEIVQQLDLIITVDSSVAHLAGALGKPVWVLSRYDGCWRWLWDGREDTPWYPTMKLYRQKSPFAWAEVINRVIGDLEKYLKDWATREICSAG